MKKRRTQSPWQKLLDDDERCELSVLDFRAKHKLSKTSFYRKSAPMKAPQPVDDAGFVRLEQPWIKPVETVDIDLLELRLLLLNLVRLWCRDKRCVVFLLLMLLEWVQALEWCLRFLGFLGVFIRWDVYLHDDLTILWLSTSLSSLCNSSFPLAPSDEATSSYFSSSSSSS